MKTKAELRNSAKLIRKNLNMGIISHEIVKNLVASSYYKNAQNIATYYPFGGEVDFTSIFKDKSKNFFIPKIFNENDMSFHKYTYGDKLKSNKYGILEPATKETRPDEFDIIILPALMADKKCFRLGYGKGYYDKFLSKYNLKIPKIILLPKELLCENLPANEYDIPANAIITQETAIIVS